MISVFFLTLYSARHWRGSQALDVYELFADGLKITMQMKWSE